MNEMIEVGDTVTKPIVQRIAPPLSAPPQGAGGAAVHSGVVSGQVKRIGNPAVAGSATQILVEWDNGDERWEQVGKLTLFSKRD